MTSGMPSAASVMPAMMSGPRRDVIDQRRRHRRREGQQALQHWQMPFRLARFVFVGAHGCPCTSAVTPLASACFALALSASLVNSRVLFGSTSLRQKSLPFLTRNGLAPCRATFVFILSRRSVHGLSKVAMREISRGIGQSEKESRWQLHRRLQIDRNQAWDRNR